jgi:hypothetical protein
MFAHFPPLHYAEEEKSNFMCALWSVAFMVLLLMLLLAREGTRDTFFHLPTYPRPLFSLLLLLLL